MARWRKPPAFACWYWRPASSSKRRISDICARSSRHMAESGSGREPPSAGAGAWSAAVVSVSPKANHLTPQASAGGGGDGVLEAIVAPEDLLAHPYARDAGYTEVAGSVGGLPQCVLHRPRLHRLGQGIGVQLTARSGDQDVVEVREVTARGECLAERCERVRDGPPRLLCEDRRPHCRQHVSGPGLRPADRGQAVGGRSPLAFAHPLVPARALSPGGPPEAGEEAAQKHRLPLRLLDLGLGEQAADPLRREVGVR